MHKTMARRAAAFLHFSTSSELCVPADWLVVKDIAINLRGLGSIPEIGQIGQCCKRPATKATFLRSKF